MTYRVVKSFADYHKGQFLEGEELVFVSRNYLPYHGGHTLIFQPRNIYLQDDESSEILHKLGQYLAPVEKA